jgi:hypothetical protein
MKVRTEEFWFFGFSWFDMIERLGKIALSFLVTNWIYSEALLFFPQLRPITKRIIAVAKIPTHNEWGGIANSRAGAALGADINHYLEHSALRNTFVKAGVIRPASKAAAQSGPTVRFATVRTRGCLYRPRRRSI